MVQKSLKTPLRDIKMPPYVVVKLFSSWQAEIMGTENVALPKWPINAFLQDLFNFLHFSTLFPALFKKVSASVDLQVMKILEMVSAFCTYFQTPGLLTLVASRGQNLRLLSIQKRPFQSFLCKLLFDVISEVFCIRFKNRSYGRF